MQDAYDWLFTRTRSGADRGPHRARALLDQLGRPDEHFRTIRVIGTNGKGSTCAMLEAGLHAAGARVGRFTSPHLERFEERVRVNTHDITSERTRAFVHWAQAHAANAPFFDLTLALAALTFRQENVELAIVEAGVGGHGDATHALRNIHAVLITNVHLDHTATLGPTIRDIAHDKAGAIHPHAPVLTTATGEALDVITHVARQRHAPLLTPATHPDLFHLPRAPRLPGPHQETNARLALAALRHLGHASGVNAALNATHPGRLERFEHAGRTIWLDGAHNPHAATALAAALPHAETLLFGSFDRKATRDTLAPLLRVARTRVFTAPGPHATDPAELAREHDGHAEPDPARALQRALTLTPEGGTLLATGSLYLVGTLRTALTAHQNGRTDT